LVKLVEVKTGHSITIRDVTASGDYRFTLYNMGLYPGARGRVVFNDGSSIVVVEVNGILVALSFSLASELEVDVET